MPGLFAEISGTFGPETLDVPVGGDGKVVLSAMTGGGSRTRPQPTSSLKYCAGGRQIHRYGGKTYAVGAGQFLLVPERNGGEAEVGRSDAAATLGLCVYLPYPADGSQGRLDAPMIFPAACSAVGRVLQSSFQQMMRFKPQRAAIARSLLDKVVTECEPLLEEAVRVLDGIPALKPATRYETLRRLNVARSYLHDVTDRAVELPELARVAGISRFQLLRHFRDAFGAPPAAYHRNLRLRLAKEEIDRRLRSCGDAAQRYGFADCSSFSHAYRRAFGTSPIRSLTSSPPGARKECTGSGVIDE